MLSGTNLAETILNGAVADTDTTITVVSGTGFPTELHALLLTDGTDNELMLATRSGTTFTVDRSTLGTTPLNWPDGSIVRCVLVWEHIAELQQGVFPGKIATTISLTNPAGWINADGAELSRTEYLGLFIATTVRTTGDLTESSDVIATLPT